MQFFEYGKTDGAPLLLYLGTPHTGDSGAELHDLALETGVRLICPTRAWYLDATAAPSFEACSAATIAWLDSQGIRHATVMGGSGGGPFALHLASNHPERFAACYLVASMGDPVVFEREVASPHTKVLLDLFHGSEREQCVEQLVQWGVPRAQALGVWGDFQVLLGSWDGIDLDLPTPVYIHHGEEDDNAPLASVQALAARLPNCTLRLSPAASHLGLANDKDNTELRTIFREVAQRLRP